MARATYVLRDGKLVEKRLAAPLDRPAAVHIISDMMDPVAHPCTGKLMDSKSEFRKVTRAHGCIEVGNERHDGRKHDWAADKAADRALERDIVRAMRNPDHRPADTFEMFTGGRFTGDGWHS